MNTQTQTYVENQLYKVYTTTDYSLFKTLRGNRDIHNVNLKRIKASFKENFLISPIIVNEYFEIIDGQHRVEASKEIGLPINFIVAKGYGLKEVKVLNTNSENWKKLDFLNAYCDLGLTPYLQLRQFMMDYPMFSVGNAEMILTNNPEGQIRSKTIDKVVVKSKGFKEGELLIDNLQDSYEIARKILMYAPYYNGYTRSTFIRTLIHLFKNSNFNNKEMIHKLSYQQQKITHCTTVGQYIFLIEDIYNYHRREKINLRF